MTSAAAPARSADHPSSLSLGTAVAGCLAVCVAQMALSIPATLNGLFQTSLHPVGSQLTWISDAFLLPVTVLELTFGVLGDLFGRKRLLVGGACLLALGELVSAAAPGVHLLWTGQVLAGLGAAALFPTSLAVIAASTHTHRDRARAIAVFAASLSTGGFLAPLVGGITGTYGSWRAAFVVMVVMGALAAVVSGVGAQDSSAPEGRSLDWGGQVTIALGLFALLFAIIQGPEDGWTATPVVIAYVVAAVFLALFIAAEGRARSPLLRLDLFRNRAFATASVVAVVGMFSFLGTAYATSIRLGPIQHQTPLRTAVAFLLLNGIALVMLPVTSRALERIDSRWVLSVGFLFMAAGDFWAATLPIGQRSLWALVGPLGLVGVGFALSVSAVTVTAVNTVPGHLAGMASAATSLLRDFGFTLGPAVIGAVALSRAGTLFGSALATSSLPDSAKAAAAQVAAAGGPLAVNSEPATSPSGAAGSIALSALGHGYALGYVVCGCAALVSCLLTVLVLRRTSATDEEAGLVEDAADGQRLLA